MQIVDYGAHIEAGTGPIRINFDHGLGASDAVVSVSSPDCERLDRQWLDHLGDPAVDQYERQVAQRQNLESVGELAAGVAHDLNNFLHVIGTSLELLARRTHADPQTQRLNRVAQQALVRATKLARQLLTLSRGHELQLEVLLLDQLEATMGDILARALPETIILQMRHEPDLWHCKADHCQLEAAILNLAINARDAMPDGGTLYIDVGNVAVHMGGSSQQAVRPGDYVVASVSDTGSGMDQSVAARAFEPFFTTKESGKGTGLGLSQVQAFAKRCNGFVTIDSVLGSGTHVHLYLPRADLP
jgi:signal transduction histidine kinase